MSIWNVFKKDNDNLNQKVHNIHERYAKKAMTRNEYNAEMQNLLLEFLLPIDVRKILKDNSVNILSVDKTCPPKCDLNQMTKLAKSSGKAVNTIMAVHKALTERATHKNPAADCFAQRYENIKVVSVSEWEEIYETAPEQEYVASTQDENFMWGKFCSNAISLAVLVPMVANNYGNMIAGKASFD